MKRFKQFLIEVTSIKDENANYIMQHQLHEHMEHAKTLKQHHEDALAYYKDVSSAHFNDELRAPAELTRNEHKDYLGVKSLDEATNHPLKHEYTAYRVIDPDYAKELLKTEPGEIYHDKGFTSTTLSPEFAKKNAESLKTIDPKNRNHNQEYKHYIKMHIPPGIKGHYLELPHRDFIEKGEHELLLHRGTKFKILKHEEKEHAGKKYMVTHMRAVSQEPSKVDFYGASDSPLKIN